MEMEQSDDSPQPSPKPRKKKLKIKDELEDSESRSASDSDMQPIAKQSPRGRRKKTEEGTTHEQRNGRMASMGLMSGGSNFVIQLPKDLNCDIETVKKYMEEPGCSFKFARRITKAELTTEMLNETIFSEEGVPLIIGEYTDGWDRDLFPWNWHRKNYANTRMENSPRDNDTCKDLRGWTVGDYVDYIKLPAEKRDPPRLYGKDMPCPPTWWNYVEDHMDRFFAYRGKYDLVACLEEELQPLSLMVYIGFEGNWTPGHKDMCGSNGHNIMVHADEDAYALWFVMARKDRDLVAKFWRENGGSIDHDNHFMSMEKLKNAPFTVYVIEQREGDFVLVPPLSPHEVYNKGGRNVKVSWNTISTQSIPTSLSSLENLRFMIKPEVYRIKATVYRALEKFVKTTSAMDKETIVKNFVYLVPAVEEILAKELISTADVGKAPFLHFDADTPSVMRLDKSHTHRLVCDFCKCDIFNRCYHCKECKRGGIDMCMDCVAEGRKCGHVKDLELAECIPNSECRKVLEAAKVLLAKYAEVPSVSNNSISVSSIAFARMELAKEEKSSYCHQCRRPRQNSTICICTKCSAKYCDTCLWGRYGIKIITCLQNRGWICLKCDNKCNCADCCRARGEDPYDPILIKERDEQLAQMQFLADFAVDLGADQMQFGGVADRKRPKARTFKKSGSTTLERKNSQALDFPEISADETKRLEEIGQAMTDRGDTPEEFTLENEPRPETPISSPPVLEFALSDLLATEQTLSNDQTLPSDETASQTLPPDQNLPAQQNLAADQALPADQTPPDQILPAEQALPSDQTLPSDPADQALLELLSAEKLDFEEPSPEIANE
eukprot:TRINITY_DN7257_c0_g1_i2.p1 TRINITY_DN7257_c0_g1~~TRINITY_DN7257_c0_g1_i2.p1  ORF type:complete len:863 (-),score=233.05 TRINITY_DN7257_c0_g1_i2:970-3477(-)